MNKKKYLHVMSEKSVTEASIELFNDTNNGNNVFVINEKYNETFKTNYLEDDKIIYGAFTDPLFHNYIKQEFKFKAIIIHGLSLDKAFITNKLKGNEIIVWLTVGGDLHNNHFLNKSLLQQETSKIVNGKLKHVLSQNKLLKSISNTLTKYLRNFSTNFKVYKKFYKIVDYVTTPIPDEYELIKKSTLIDAEYLDFEYPNNGINKLLKSSNEDLSEKRNLYIGSSASPTSNHMDVLKNLSTIDISNRKIIVTLSYKVSSKEYVEEIIKYGKSCFGQMFLPVMNYQSFNEYVNSLNSCGFAIFNHERQEAIGSIRICLYKGLKVYLSENNVFYKYLKRKGFTIFSTQSDLVDYKSLDKELSDIEKKNNQKLIKELLERENPRKLAQNLISKINSRSKSNKKQH